MVNTDIQEPENSTEDIKQQVYRYLKFWPLFIISVLFFFSLAYIYLRYSTSIYSTTAKVKVLDQSDSGLDFSSMSGSTTLFNLNKINLENQIHIFKSRRLINKVIEELDLNTFYYSDATFKPYLIDQADVPFKVHWLKEDSVQISSSPAYHIILKNETFKIFTDDNSLDQTYNYQDTLLIDGRRFRIEKNKNISFQKYLNQSFTFRYANTESLISQLANQLIIEPSGTVKSDILQLAITGPNKKRNEKIINSLIKQFNKDGIEDKRLISKRTEDFVEERILLLEEELDTVESGLVNYKTNNDLVAIEANTEQLFGKEAQAESGRLQITTQLMIANEFKNELQSVKGFRLLPANIGVEDASVNELTKQYNELIIERNRLLISSTEENPLVVNLNEKLEELNSSIVASVDAYLRNLKISLSNFERQENSSSGVLSSLPKKEKEIREIMRQQEIKERLYLFLLQKREEAALSYAITAPTIKIVDYAYTGSGPISPNRKNIYLGSMVFGFLLPLGVLYLVFLIDTKVNSKVDIEKKLNKITIIGEIPEIKKGNDTIITPNDRTILAESFRILRTNLGYFNTNENQTVGKVIFVTSSTKGEGKTFTGINLASSFASTGKKVLLLGCDLRNPQIHSYIQKDKNYKGVSAFLYQSNLILEDLIIRDAFPFSNLDVVLSGSIPPNPAELLMNERMEVLLNQAKSIYDIVIVDTAPTILVTDTLLISQLADVTVYMLRAGVTDKRLLDHIQELYKSEKLRKVGLVINGVKESKGYGYNYGYGYGYTEDTSVGGSRWKFWKR